MSEHLLTREELEASKGATGRIVRIVGPVVDVEFPAESMPGIYNALTVDAKTLAGDMHVVLEVETPRGARHRSSDHDAGWQRDPRPHLERHGRAC